MILEGKMGSSVLKKVLLVLVMLCLIVAGMYLLNKSKENKRTTASFFVPEYHLIAELDQYLGKEVRTIGVLSPIDPESEFQRLRLFPFKEYLDFDELYYEQLALRVELKKEFGQVKIPERCLYRYVMISGIVGESVLPGLPAIKEVDFVAIAENEDDRICQFVKYDVPSAADRQ